MSMSMNVHTSVAKRFEPTIDVYEEGRGCCLNIYLSDPSNRGYMVYIHADSNKALNEFILQFKEAASKLQLIEVKEKEEKDERE